MKNILIVDDNKDFADVLCDILNDNHLVAESCYSGYDAVERVRQKLFDVTFLDVKMPEKDGVETLREIKRIRPESRIVMMTGYSMDEQLQRAIEESSSDVIFKPFDIDKVIELINSA